MTRIIVIFVILLNTSCCTLLPFKKCSNNSIVYCKINAESNTNNGRPVKLAGIYFTDLDNFENNIPANLIFSKNDNKINDNKIKEQLKILNDIKIVTIAPKEIVSFADTIEILPDLKNPFYYGIIAWYSDPVEGKDRVAIKVANKRMMVNIRLFDHEIDVDSIK